MTPRVGAVLLLAALVACGAETAGSVVTESASSTDLSTTSSTVAPDRSVPAEEALFHCSLERAVVNASAVVHLAVDRAVALETWQPPPFDSYGGLETRTTFDPVWVDPAADIVRGSIADIVATREHDPRGVEPLRPGMHTVVQQLRGSVLPDLWASGESVVALVGPWGVRGAPAWSVHAALTERDDGAVGFLGPCATHFDRDLAAIAARRNTAPDLSLLNGLMQHALDPGAAADLQYMLHGWGFGSLPSDDMAVPPMLFGNVRVTGVVYVVTGSVNGVMSMRSNGIWSGASAALAGGGQPFAAGVGYTPGHVIELLWTMAPDQPVVIASFDPADVPSDGGLVAEVDTANVTGTLRAVGIDEFSALSGYSVETLRTYKAGFETSQRLDDSVAEPERYDPDGLIER